MKKMVNLFTIDHYDLRDLIADSRLPAIERDRIGSIRHGRGDRETAFRLGFRLAGERNARAATLAADVMVLEREIRSSYLNPDDFGVTLELESGEKCVGPVVLWDPEKLRIQLRGYAHWIDYSEIKEHGSYNF